MSRRFLLPAPPSAPSRSRAEGARLFLLRSRLGRVLLGALGIWLVEGTGLPLPSSVYTVARVLVYCYLAWGAFRLVRSGLRRFLWRIRTKLILSYVFIALVPVVLLSLFFFIAAVLLVSLVASHFVTSELERLGQTLKITSRMALLGAPAEGAGDLEERLEVARTVHPQVAYALVRRGRVVASRGRVPTKLPPWLKEPDFAGLVRSATEGEPEVLRAVAGRGDSFLVVDAPVDAVLFSALERRTTIRLLSAGGTVRQRADERGISIEVGDERRIRLTTNEPNTGFKFMAAADRTEWESGKKEIEGLAFQFRPYEMMLRLRPADVDIGGVLVLALAVVGVIFLVMYAVAFLIGLLLARSITRGVHALSVGTLRLRQGDFSQPVAVTSRDQLGELAESFNLMTRGIQDLLREQVEKERLEEELRIARQIQMSLLPVQGVSVPGLRIAALCLPAAEVGGDYYDLLPLSETRLGVLVADVSGKGTSAALYMAELKGLVLSLSRIYDSPARLLTEANRILSANMDSRTFITMTYAVLDIAAGRMRYARAGHNPIIHLEAGTGQTRILTPPGLGLGLDRGDRFAEVLEERETPLGSGDVLLFFTDGLSEAMNPQSELFGESRLRRIIEGGGALSSDELKERILHEVRGFVGGAAQNDDMTMVILKVV